ncbi:hypothetical protein ACNKHR_17410 [Shigella flexneri]
MARLRLFELTQRLKLLLSSSSGTRSKIMAQLAVGIGRRRLVKDIRSAIHPAIMDNAPAHWQSSATRHTREIKCLARGIH